MTVDSSSNPQRKKALAIGGAMIDTIAIIDSERIERMAMRNAESAFLLLEEGRKTEASEISNHCGGGGINSAVAMARLNLDVSLLAKLGKDERGETVLARLRDENISDKWIMRDDRAATGASVIVSSHERDAAIFTFRGANTLLDPSELDDAAFDVDLIYVSGLSNESADCFPSIIHKGADRSALLAANPGIRQLTARGHAFFDCLSNIDIVIVNRVEANAMVPAMVARFGEGHAQLPLDVDADLPDLVARGFVSGGFDISAGSFFAGLVSLGPKYVVVTDGTRGVYVAHGDRLLFCAPLKVEVAGTAGAGDAFGSTFAAAMAAGRPVETAIRSAVVNAASVVGHVDTQTGLLAWDEIERRIRLRETDLRLQSWDLPQV